MINAARQIISCWLGFAGEASSATFEILAQYAWPEPPCEDEPDLDEDGLVQEPSWYDRIHSEEDDD